MSFHYCICCFATLPVLLTFFFFLKLLLIFASGWSFDPQRSRADGGAIFVGNKSFLPSFSFKFGFFNIHPFCSGIWGGSWLQNRKTKIVECHFFLLYLFIKCNTQSDVWREWHVSTNVNPVDRPGWKIGSQVLIRRCIFIN